MAASGRGKIYTAAGFAAINAIAPEVPVSKVIWGTLPHVIGIMLAIVILCIFAEIATWLPNRLIGIGK